MAEQCFATEQTDRLLARRCSCTGIVDLTQSLTDNQVAAIRQAWLEHQVIFFRDQDLMEHIDFQCRFRWTPHSIAMWDNRCSQHHAAWDYYPEVRRGYRVTSRSKDQDPFYLPSTDLAVS